MPFYSPSQLVNLRTLITSASDRRRRTHLTTHLTSHLTRLLLRNLRAKTFRKLGSRCHLTLLSSLIYGLRRVILEHLSVFFEPGSPRTCSSPDRLVPGKFFPEASGSFRTKFRENCFRKQAYTRLIQGLYKAIKLL